MKEEKIRTANSIDAAAIALVLAASFTEYESLYTEKGYAATTLTESGIKSRFAEGEVWVATVDERIVGTISGVSRNESLYIRGMAILPQSRGHQIGYHLLLEIESYAIARRIRRLTLSTTPFLDRAIRLYEKFGFLPVGTDDLFGTPLITMEKELSTANRKEHPRAGIDTGQSPFLHTR
jgi:GNAT superfamily N-acetyltransferase